MRPWVVAALLTLAPVGVSEQAHACKPAPLPDGIVSVDTLPRARLDRMIREGYRPEIGWEEAFSEFVDVNAYAPNLSVEDAYDFVQDIYNLEKWTISVRDVEPWGTLDGAERYRSTEGVPPFGYDYFLEDKYPEIHTVDWRVGKTEDDIWMHYYMRILDAQTYIGKPGILITWVNFGHSNFEQDPVLKQGFLMMRIAHGIERNNLIKILNWRATGHTEPVDAAISAELGLINIETLPAMDIYNMVAAQMTPTVAWDDLYGGFVGSHFLVSDQPVMCQNPSDPNQAASR